MSPVVLQLTEGITDPVQAEALWWSLAIGADFGGNLTAIGASANVVVLGVTKRSGFPISFWQFTKKGAVVTVITVVLAATYLWLRYFVISG
jgi:Na+/H+ antiporter NhaD/arsenite permease-like protein